MRDQRHGGIAWTDYTANPVRYKDADGKDVWACVKHSAGCANCYAEALAIRWKKGDVFNRDNMAKLTPYFRDDEAQALIRSPHVAGKRVFIGDMTDVAGEWIEDEILDRLFAVMAIRSDVTFQVLTKRPGRLAEYFKSGGGPNVIQWSGEPNVYSRIRQIAEVASEYQKDVIRAPKFPFPNVWIGTSVANQDAVGLLDDLMRVPAALRFASVEPLIGRVVFAKKFKDGGRRDYLTGQFHNMPTTFSDGRTGTVETCDPKLPKLDWVIVGGESGMGSRECSIEWIRDIIHQCRTANVPVFVKQFGQRPIAPYYDPIRMTEQFKHGDTWPDPYNHDIDRDGQPGASAMVKLPIAGKGSKPEEWPEEFRVQMFPRDIIEKVYRGHLCQFCGLSPCSDECRESFQPGAGV